MYFIILSLDDKKTLLSVSVFLLFYDLYFIM